MKKTIGILLSVAVIIFIVSSALIKTNAEAPPNTRVILDHTSHIYIAPPCFEAAEVTNYLEETTYERALQIEYQPDSSCTEEALAGEEKAFLFVLFEKIGLKAGQWDKNGEWRY